MLHRTPPGWQKIETRWSLARHSPMLKDRRTGSQASAPPRRGAKNNKAPELLSRLGGSVEKRLAKDYISRQGSPWLSGS
jgi:hypothetical protein